MAGDSNKFDTAFVCHDLGLFSIVDAPTQGSNILDEVFVNQT